MQPLPPKQLSMVIDEATVGWLPDVPLPAGYVIRACRPEDTASWACTLRAGGFESWGEKQVLKFLESPERRKGSRVVEWDGRIVAATFATRISNRTPMTDVGDFDPLEEGALDYVVTHPEHRGRGSGKGHLHGGLQVPGRPRVQDGLTGHGRLEAAGNPHLPLDGFQTGYEQERHAGALGGRLREAEGERT